MCWACMHIYLFQSSHNALIETYGDCYDCSQVSVMGENSLVLSKGTLSPIKISGLDIYKVAVSQSS